MPDTKHAKILPHRYNGRFYNYEGEVLEDWLIPSIAMFFHSLYARLLHKKEHIKQWVCAPTIMPLSNEPHITWLGHSTFLIQVAGVSILTDPVFGNASCFFPRIFPCGIAIDQLPPIDCVLISHNHPDHMDAASLYALKKHNPLFLVPHGDKKWFVKRNFERVEECMWWEPHAITSKTMQLVEFTFLPAHHWSQRGLFDGNRSLWGSWLIQAPQHTIYFAGDTAYSKHFKNIARHYASINTALMPIAPCEPRRWMKNTHLSAEEAVQAFIDLNADTFIPMHWGTYHFGSDQLFAPIERLMQSWHHQRAALQDKKVQLLKIGQLHELLSLPMLMPENQVLEQKFQ
jgi:L-ascorbate metabolism protein UlaG (beta-lactamase superfamily)